MSRLLLVRHGDTESNSAERYWGSTDVELSAAGLRQAERLSERLAGEKLDAIYSSDLVRASLTARIIATRHQMDAIICEELREVNFGKLEGLTFAEISQLYPEVADLWARRRPELKYPGGESLDQFNKRVSHFRNRLKGNDVSSTSLIVAHSGVLRTLICQLLGIGLDYRWQLRLDLGSLSILETHSEGATLSLLNDISHLRR